MTFSRLIPLLRRPWQLAILRIFFPFVTQMFLRVLVSRIEFSDRHTHTANQRLLIELYIEARTLVQ